MESEQNVIEQSQDVETAETQEVGGDVVDTSSESAVDSKVDWWNPETWGKTPAKDIVKNIQRKYNENATKVKTLEKDYSVAQKELTEVVNDVKRALSDENYYRERRRSLGYVDTSPPEKQPELDFSKFETVEDVQSAFSNLKNYFENKIVEIERKSDQKATAKIEAVAAPIAQERWSIAIKDMVSKYGDVWSKAERKVVSNIANGNYIYRPGSEKEILDKVFRAECPEEYESFLTENLRKKAIEKKGAVTASSKVQTPKLKATGSSVDDIIARVNSKLGPNAIKR